MNFIKQENLADQIIEKQSVQYLFTDNIDEKCLIFNYKGVPYYFNLTNLFSESDVAEALKVLNCETATTPFHYTDRDYYLELFDEELSKDGLDGFETALIAKFPQHWEIDYERIACDSKTLIFYAAVKTESTEYEDFESYYSLVEPKESIKYKKVQIKLDGAYRAFEGLDNANIEFAYCLMNLSATIESENLFITDEEVSIPKSVIEMKTLNELSKSNYKYDFQIEFSCLVKEKKTAIFDFETFKFEYKY